MTQTEQVLANLKAQQDRLLADLLVSPPKPPKPVEAAQWRARQNMEARRGKHT